MSEPASKASQVEVVVPGVRHWSVADERIGGSLSHAYAVGDGSVVLVDPLPLTEEALASLGKVDAICFTIQSHQRSSWRLRRQLGVKVYGPRDAVGLEEQPDVWYGDGDTLPGGLRAIHAPGPCEASYAFHLAAPGVLFISDLLMGDRDLSFVPDEYQDEPALTRTSVKALVDVGAEIVCPGHGQPLTSGGTAALRRALERARRRPG